MKGRENMRFINDDVKLKIGGRKAVKITKENLGKLILNKALHAPEAMVNVLGAMDAKWYEGCEYCQFLQLVTALMSDSTIQKDNKFQTYAENVCGHEYVQDEEEVGNHLMGMHTLDNGLTFFGFAVGGDWGLPVYMIIYSDGKTLRLYTPSCGNSVNLDFKCALGSEDVNCNDADKIVKKYKKLGIYPGDEKFLMDSEGPAVTYLAKYDISEDAFFDGFVPYNWDAIKRDIEARIEVC